MNLTLIEVFKTKSFAIFGALVFPFILLCWGGFFFFKSGVHFADFLTFFVFYQLSLFGLSVGSHRYFSHRSFKTSTFFESLLFILASSTLQYSPLYWASFHRKHHQFTDKPGDPHSPWTKEVPHSNLFWGWIHSHFLWGFSFDFNKTVSQYSPDLLAKKHLLILHRIHYPIGLSFILLAGIFEYSLVGTLGGFWRGLYFGGLFRIFILHNSVFFLNSIAGHGFGYRRFPLSDKSTNNIFLFPLLLGEAWHHNHHANQNSANNQIAWYEFDPHFFILKIFSRLNLIWELK